MTKNEKVGGRSYYSLLVAADQWASNGRVSFYYLWKYIQFLAKPLQSRGLCKLDRRPQLLKLELRLIDPPLHEINRDHIERPGALV